MFAMAILPVSDMQRDELLAAMQPTRQSHRGSFGCNLAAPVPVNQEAASIPSAARRNCGPAQRIYDEL